MFWSDTVKVKFSGKTKNSIFGCSALVIGIGVAMWFFVSVMVKWGRNSG